MDEEDKLEILENAIENIIFGSEISYHEYKLLNEKQKDIKAKNDDLLYQKKIYIQFYNYKGKPIISQKEHLKQKQKRKSISKRNGKKQEDHNKSFYDDFKLSDIMVNREEG